jgi:hypothetical protein
VFNAPTNGFLARGIAGWIFGFHFFGQGATAYVQERLIEDTRSQRIYLQPGDEVVAEARRLGRITSQILPPEP